MSKITIKSLLLAVLAIIPMAFYAQNAEESQAKPNNNHYWYVGFDEGATLLFGDNKPGDYIKNVRPEIGIHGGYTFAKHFSAYGRVSAGTLKGSLANTFTVENASFFAYDLNLSADLISLIWGYNPDRVFGLKPHVGFGQMMYQARINSKGQTIKVGYDDSPKDLKGNGIGGRRIVWELPFGVEFEFNLNRKCALYLDIATTYTDTDRLEAYAGGKHYDWFSTGAVGFRYKFRKADPAPVAVPTEEKAPDCEACKDAIQQAVKDAVEEALKDYQPAPAAVAPVQEEADDAEALEKYYEEKDIHLTFKVGKAVVEDTKANKDQVKEVSDEMEAGREIHTIKTIGYASPEGNEKQNQTLSENRAKATADYIQKELGDKAEGIQFDAKGMGSDWDGFFKALDESNIAKKAEIAETIKNADDQTAALNQMKAKYPELNNLLNSLRRTQVYINK